MRNSQALNPNQYSQVPPEMRYVGYMVVVTSLSQRHINALAETIRRIYKKKKNRKDPSLICEGKSTNWMALDMGKRICYAFVIWIKDEWFLMGNRLFL